MSTVQQEERRLRRSRTDQVLGGVCAGLAHFFNTDPLLIRLVFVVFTLAQGAGVLLYVLLWVLMPAEGAEPVPAGADTIRTGVAGVGSDVSRAAERLRRAAPDARRQGMWLGALLVAVGLYLLALNEGLFAWWNWSVAGPVLLILIGLAVIVRRLRG